MVHEADDIRSLKHVAGNLALDFSNTANRDGGRVIIEWLRTADDWYDWAQSAGIIDAVTRVSLPHEAAPLEQARALREAIYALGAAVAAGEQVDYAAVALLDGAARAAAGRRALMWSAGGLAWTWTGDHPALKLIDEVALAAVEVFLTQGRMIRQCAGAQCGWLFVDTSRNRARRWCDMSDCGNRAKARRHYARPKG
jgi:predicted RNA-binding Zn ribbon-like protein